MPTTEFNDAQLLAARAKMWHQDGEALLTLEAARTWVREMGLVLFAPRPQIAAPAASLVEATLGHANPAPSLAETETARGFVARLVQEGEALPLHLLGEASDVPDFVVSAQMFSFVFTLRGDKAWKQPPVATSVSPLASKVYEELTSRGALSATELASELGREVSESAVVRALVELWSNLRVLPLAQQGSSATRWELASARFLKAIKSGSNAGLPTALSALTSVYLSQAIVATEEEISTFLSPLTARSRVREVVHALTSARQLETVVLEGKTLLHVPGALPEFAPAIAVEAAEGVEEAPAVFEKPKKIGTGRIGKFAAESKDASEFRGKPVKKPGVFSKTGPGFVKPSARFGPRADGKSDRDRRPFSKDGAKPGFKPRMAGKPTFTKPWEEDRKPRAKAAEGGAFQKFRKPEGEDRKPLGDREQAGLPPAKRAFSKPKYERESFARDAARKPSGASEGGAGAAWKKPRSFAKPDDGSGKPSGFAAKRPYKPRDAEGGERREFKPRSFEKKPFGKKPFEKKPFGSKPFAKKPFDKKPGGFGAKRPFTPRDAEGGERPAFKPRSFEAKPFAKKPFEKKPYTPRTTEGSDRGEFKPRSFEKKPFTKKPFESKPGGFGAKKPYAARGAEGGERTFSKPRFGGGGRKPGGFGARRTSFTPVDDNAERTLPKRPYKPRAADADQRKFTKAPWTPSENAGAGAKRKSFGGPKKFGGKPSGFGAKRSGPPRGARPPRKREE